MKVNKVTEGLYTRVKSYKNKTQAQIAQYTNLSVYTVHNILISETYAEYRLRVLSRHKRHIDLDYIAEPKSSFIAKLFSGLRKKR